MIDFIANTKGEFINVKYVQKFFFEKSVGTKIVDDLDENGDFIYGRKGFASKEISVDFFNVFARMSDGSKEHIYQSDNNDMFEQYKSWLIMGIVDD